MGNGYSSSVVGITSYNVTTVDPAGSRDASIKSVLGGVKWGGALGNSVTLTYSLSDTSSQFIYNEPTKGNLSTQQTSNATSAMTLWSNVANITFNEVEDTASSAGDIRWTKAVSASQVGTAYAYYPSSYYPQGGDVWVGPNIRDGVAGTYGYQTFIHELGHALGLDHPHEGAGIASVAEDSLKYSVMSYRSYAGDDLSGYTNAFFPTTPMLNDIAAMQFLYGVNTTYHATDTTYTWTNNQKIFETIWDGGGSDTIDASNQSLGVVIQLTSGAWSQIGASFWNGKAYVRDCLTIAYGATVENAIGTAQNDTLNGNGVANRLEGGAGNDILNGLAGADTMIGGAGNDSYYVDNVGDIVTEDANEGADRVYSSVSYTLGDNIEYLTLTGTASITGTGNELNNSISGNAGSNVLRGEGGNDTLVGGVGNDTLNGGDGLDTMLGGAGNDIYYVDNISDKVYETLSATSTVDAGGYDAVYSSITYTLGSFVEKLLLTGSDNINGNGNSLNNNLIGNSGNNVLSGGSGNDTLYGSVGDDKLYGGAGLDTLNGGAGSDIFVFNTALNTSTNRDTITDFTPTDDTFYLENAIFTKLTTLGTLSSAYFKSTTTGRALDTNDYIVYNPSNGILGYDADGSGGGALVQIALLGTSTHPTLTYADFVVI